MKSNHPNYITPQGFKLLQDEYYYLVKVLRPETTKLVSWAASLGDRSENADYQYGKKKLREIDRRMRFLSSRIEAAKVVDPLKIESEKVQFSATVTVEDEEGEQEVYTIVGVDEIDSEKKYISWLSPKGKALLGKEVGDEVIIKVPKGEISFTIEEIKYIEVAIKEYIYTPTVIESK